MRNIPLIFKYYALFTILKWQKICPKTDTKKSLIFLSGKIKENGPAETLKS